MRRMVACIMPLAMGVALTSFGCSSLDDNPRPLELRAPDLDCAGCYVVNAAISIAGSSVFVGGYADSTERGIVRRFGNGQWSTLLGTTPQRTPTLGH